MRYLISILVLMPILAMAETTGFELLRSEVISTPQSQVTETEWRHTDASGQAIGLHRYRSAGAETIATLLYLPGTNMNGVLKVTDSDHNLWLYLAQRGVEVYAMDYRTR